MLRMGRYSGFAPSRRKMGLTAVWVRPKLNWTPKNPRFIQAMFREVIRGRRSSPDPTSVTSAMAVDTRHAPSAADQTRVIAPQSAALSERLSALTIDVDVVHR